MHHLTRIHRRRDREGNRIYTREEIEKAKVSPSFEREYNLKYLGRVGNVFHTLDIESAICTQKEGQEMMHWCTSTMIGRRMGIDVIWGDTSKFAIVITQYSLETFIEICHKLLSRKYDKDHETIQAIVRYVWEHSKDVREAIAIVKIVDTSDEVNSIASTLRGYSDEMRAISKRIP